MSERFGKLNELSLKEFTVLFKSLEIPQIPQLRGYFSGTFVGPVWLRTAAGPALIISGLGGWWGKHFEGDGAAINLVQRNQKLEPRFPMQLIHVNSVIDGKQGLALHYGKENPFPWPHINDELRKLGDGAYLGMTYVHAGILRSLVFPFLLEFQEQVHGL